MPQRWLDAWRTAGAELRPMACGDGHLLCFSRGARALPLDQLGRPLLWTPPALAGAAAARSDPNAMTAWLQAGGWDVGGERLWIAPEIRFMIHDRGDFDGSYELQPAMDPGRWTSVPAGTGAVGYRQSLELLARDSGERLRLEAAQWLTPTADPLRRSGRPASLRHLGWTREVRLQRAEDDPGTVPCQAWAIVQLPPGATAYLPQAASARLSDYFEPVDDAHLRHDGPHLALRIDGQRRYKVGVRSGEHRGQLLYWRAEESGQATLVLRRFLDLPSSRYLEQPPALPEHEGDSAYVYNDDGRYGGFGELEALGRALEPAQATVADLFELHLWWGPVGDAAEVARVWLGEDWRPPGV